MNRDPERRIDAQSGASLAERDLLKRLSSLSAPVGAVDAGWEAIGLESGLATLGAELLDEPVSSLVEAAKTGSGGLGSASTETLSFGARLLSAPFSLPLLAVGLTVGGAGWLLARSDPPKAPPPIASQSPELVPDPNSNTVSSPEVQLEAIAKSRAEPPPPPPPTLRPRSIDTSTDLAEESALLAKARASLRSGDAGATKAVLRELDTRFPRGELRQEREVIQIEWLAGQGQKEAARKRARAFIAAHPSSPHAARLERLLGQ
jgi:hypothetical protein